MKKPNDESNTQIISLVNFNLITKTSKKYIALLKHIKHNLKKTKRNEIKIFLLEKKKIVHKRNKTVNETKWCANSV